MLGKKIKFKLPKVPGKNFLKGKFVTFEPANPDQNLANPSSMVGKLVRYKGAPYGGSRITFANNLDFANHPDVTMKVWTSAPIGTYVTLKAEKPFWGEERSVQTTKTGEWETLSFNFANAPLDMPTLTLLFDFTAGSTNVGDGTANSTFYFDDLKFANVPLSFEEVERESTLLVYPNPTASSWTLSNLPDNAQNVTLMNIQGQLLWSRSVVSEEPLLIDASMLPKGTYLLKVRTENGQVHRILEKI